MAIDSLTTFRRKQDEKRTPEEVAALAAAAGVAIPAGSFVAKHEILDALANRDVTPTRAYDDFVDKLEKGDVLFHHRGNKTSAHTIGKMGTEADWMMGAKGDPYYHASIYQGGDKIAEASDFDTGVRKNAPVRADVPENIRAYRPKNQEDILQALKYAKDAHGSEYAGDLGSIIKHGASHLFSPTGGPDASCANAKNPQVCTQFVANAYPEIFEKELASPASMRHAADLDLVARYEPRGARTLRELFLTRGVYPIAKSLKYGAAAGALGYGAKSIYDHLKGDDTNGR